LEAFTGGEGRARVEVQTAGAPARCGSRFASGREYLVYATRAADGTLITGSCSRTRPIDRAAEDLAYISNVISGVVLGSVRTSVVLRTRNLATGRDAVRPLANAAVTLRRGDFSIGGSTNSAGLASFANLAPGVYDASVTPSRDGEFRTTLSPAELELADARACAVLTAVVIPNGHISGRVVNERGAPVEGLTVELAAVNARGQISPAGEIRRAVTTRDGFYEMNDIPPGRFLVGVNVRGGLDGEGAALYPEKVEVPLGRRVALGALAVPASLAIVQLSGVVLDAAGAPAEGARVFLRGPSERDYVVGEPVVADFVGRFTIAAVAGDYVLFAERVRAGDAHGRLDVSETLHISRSDYGRAVKLTLRRR
jgi:hypothetical protein